MKAELNRDHYYEYCREGKLQLNAVCTDDVSKM